MLKFIVCINWLNYNLIDLKYKCYFVKFTKSYPNIKNHFSRYLKLAF